MQLRYFLPVLLLGLAACTDSAPDNANDAHPPSGATAAAPAAEGLFRSSCAGCHGADGHGIGNAANLLTSSLDSAAIAQVITHGKGAMPPLRSLGDAEVRLLAGYVYGLRRK